MADKQALQKENFFKAINHIEPDWIPKVSHGNNAILDWAGTTFYEVEGNREKTEAVLRHYLDSIPVDVGSAGFNASPKTYAALDNMTETFLGPDGITLQHLQRPTMKPDEYPLLIEDIHGFVKETLLPRKFPTFFADKEGAKEKVKTILDESASRILGFYNELQQSLYVEYGVYPYPTGKLPRFLIPIDYVFDRLRGFQGTLADLRRRPAEVHAALDVIYRERATTFKDTKEKDLFASYMAHIPCYLNPKQYDEFFWPHFKEMVTNLGDTGNKLYIFLEGKWLPFCEGFLDLPKDSLYGLVDDDEILDLNKVFGHHHTLVGGVKMQNIKFLSAEKNIDYAKRVIDEVGPGGGYIFGCNKSWLCKGDMNQTLVDVYNFANEYGRK
ncbi:MAG: hypothetical protein FWG10_07885 [Eubacteriaceae bacterium]|nr:hypothetical protein [Eubacteriaceae bacterium]